MVIVNGKQNSEKLWKNKMLLNSYLKLGFCLKFNQISRFKLHMQ